VRFRPPVIDLPAVAVTASTATCRNAGPRSPLALAGTTLPSTALPAWRDADVWNYGHVFFYEQSLGDRHVSLRRPRDDRACGARRRGC